MNKNVSIERSKLKSCISPVINAVKNSVMIFLLDISLIILDNNMAQSEQKDLILHCVQILDSYSPDDVAMEEHFFNYLDSIPPVSTYIGGVSVV